MKELLKGKLDQIYQKRLLFWVVAVGILIIFHKQAQNPPKEILGIALAPQKTVVANRNARISQVFVELGQKVEPGTRLLSLDDKNLDIEIERVKRELITLRAEVMLDSDFRKKLSTGSHSKSIKHVIQDNPTILRIDSLKEELRILELQKLELDKYASIAGEVSEVFFNEGDNAKAFEPIMTINQRSPQFIKAYLHESFPVVRNRQLKKVSISPKNNPTIKYFSENIRLGHNIKQLPVRLMKNPNQPIFGMEIIIRLPENSLVVGEKVVVEIINNNSKAKESSIAGNLLSKLTLLKDFF